MTRVNAWLSSECPLFYTTVVLWLSLQLLVFWPIESHRSRSVWCSSSISSNRDFIVRCLLNAIVRSALKTTSVERHRCIGDAWLTPETAETDWGGGGGGGGGDRWPSWRGLRYIMRRPGCRTINYFKDTSTETHHLSDTFHSCILQLRLLFFILLIIIAIILVSQFDICLLKSVLLVKT